MEDDDFEWHDQKAADTAAERGLSFEAAKAIFNDPFALEFDDDREPYPETRIVRIGIVDGRHLVVVYTPRERIRFISVRKAERHEKRRYHEGDRDL